MIYMEIISDYKLIRMTSDNVCLDSFNIIAFDFFMNFAQRFFGAFKTMNNISCQLGTQLIIAKAMGGVNFVIT